MGSVRRYHFEGATPEKLAKALLNQADKENQENQENLEAETTTEEDKDEPQELSS